MKTPVICRATLALVVALAFAASGQVALAQVKEPVAPLAVAAEGILPAVDFRDAKLTDLVDFLDKKSPGLNVIVQPKVQNVTVTLKLRNVTVRQILEAIPFATGGQVEVTELQENMFGLNPGASQQQLGADGEPIKAECRIFSLSNYLSGKDEKAQDIAHQEVLESLAIAMRMLREANPETSVKMPNLQMNRSTQLLIAVGLPDELAVVEQLVMALQGHAVAVPAAARPGTGPGRVPGMPALAAPSGFQNSGARVPQPPRPTPQIPGLAPGAVPTVPAPANNPQ